MEAQFISWLRRQLPEDRRVPLGVGDDAAVVRFSPGADCVATTDLISEGVDFHLEETTPELVGRKALAVNLSDLAAMAARPVAALVTLLLPRQGGFQIAARALDGMLPLARRYGAAIAGGDTNSWEGGLAIAVTALGETTPRGPLTRRGAQPGDWILVTGQFGGSILGRHLTFEPRVEEALLLAERYALHAGIDVSDGLALDLARLAEESGCGAMIRRERIPVAPAAHELARTSGRAPLEHALGDGEDFELILAVPPLEAARLLSDQPIATPVTHVGEFVSERGLWLAGAAGAPTPLPAAGWQHAF